MVHGMEFIVAVSLESTSHICSRQMVSVCIAICIISTHEGKVLKHIRLFSAR